MKGNVEIGIVCSQTFYYIIHGTNKIITANGGGLNELKCKRVGLVNRENKERRELTLMSFKWFINPVISS